MVAHATNIILTWLCVKETIPVKSDVIYHDVIARCLRKKTAG